MICRSSSYLRKLVALVSCTIIYSQFIPPTRKLNAVTEDLVTVQFIPNKLIMEIGGSSNSSIVLSNFLTASAEFLFVYNKYGIVNNLTAFTLRPDTNTREISINGKSAGSVIIRLNVTDVQIIASDKAFLQVTVIHCHSLDILSQVIGWMYFVAWCIGGYPQIYLNWKRKSVTGLNFDFLALNYSGAVGYLLYNVCLFWSPTIQAQYHSLYPISEIPVKINDVVFSIHSVAIASVCVFQVFIYERGDQRLSITCITIHCLIGIFAFVSLFVAIGDAINWLTYLSFLSYIKLVTTVMRNIPQAFMNFQRKSTTGWSIARVHLDFAGAALSITQMFILSYNNNDWQSIFSNFTKLGLGIVAILFDVLFMLQHYVLYRERGATYQAIGGGGIQWIAS